MDNEIKSKYAYILSGFLIGFLFTFIIVTIEDFNHKVPLSESVNFLHHYLGPLFLGILSGFIAYFYWTNQIQKNAAINLFNKRINTYLNINKAFISSIELDKILQIVIDTSTHIVNLNSGAIYLITGENLYLGATTPALPDQFPEVFRHDKLFNHPHIQKSVETGKPVTINDTSKAKLSDAEQMVVNTRNLRSILYIPLVIENRAVGVLILGTMGELRTFTDSDIGIFNAFSAQAALAIENSLLYRKSVQISNELKQQNEEFLSLNEELSENYERIQSINDELKKAKEKAEESERLKSDFLNNISHEVRTPLNAIVGFSSLISEPDVMPDKLNAFAKMISLSSEKLINIITDVIEISQIQANLIQANLSKFEYTSLVYQLVENFKENCQLKGVKLQILFGFPGELLLNSDEQKLSRVIFHLIDNAVKFTSEGSIIIKNSIENEYLVVSVSDTGIGISEEKQKVIFEPFRQVETGVTRNFGGNGLGLAIIKSYVDLLKGSISLQSEINKGSTFTVKIPLNLTAVVNTNIKTSINKKPARTLLIVEDEYSNYQYLVALLEGYNVRIIYAENGQKAVDVCRNNSEIDCILMDIKMPVMDGHTSAKMIKAFRDVPIIAQTAYALESEKASFIATFDDYVTKPINKKILREKMSKYLEFV